MKTAILITYDKEDAVNEAKALCDSAGYIVPQIIKQKFLKRPKYGISEEILKRLEDASAGCRLRKVLVGLLEAEIQSKLGLMSLG